MSYTNKEKQKEYVRQWIAKRRATWFADKICFLCGSTDRLELDHIDPRLKVANSIWSWSEIRRSIELAKCQVLCYDCHLFKTRLEREPTHGTETRYSKYGCRCDECKNARKISKANIRLKRKELGLPYQ